jgi:hypothetical protein
MHPLAPNLTGLTDDDLHKKRAELTNRLMFSYRMGHGDMVAQINMLIQDYDAEIQVRNQRMLDELSKNNKNFDDKINIGK